MPQEDLVRGWNQMRRRLLGQGMHSGSITLWAQKCWSGIVPALTGTRAHRHTPALIACLTASPVRRHLLTLSVMYRECVRAASVMLLYLLETCVCGTCVLVPVRMRSDSAPACCTIPYCSTLMNFFYRLLAQIVIRFILITFSIPRQRHLLSLSFCFYCFQFCSVSFCFGTNFTRLRIRVFESGPRCMATKSGEGKRIRVL
jgi:hypothetical protein